MPVRLHWKAMFYKGLLPRLVRLDAARAERQLIQLGSFVQRTWGPCRRSLNRAVRRATRAVELPHDQAGAFRRALGEHVTRTVARDFLLDGRSDREVDLRFQTEGFEHVVDALAQGDGLILLGSHLGAYVPALHWLYRQDLPLRAMIQRPRHVSHYLQAQLDRTTEPYPSSSLFLRRDLERREAVERCLRARSALREGLALYVCGDITTPGGYPACWFGQPVPLLEHWTQLAASSGARVVPLFATFLPEGKYQIRFEAPFRVDFQRSGEAISHYLRLLEDTVRTDPAQAVPYWTWPSFRFSADPLPAPPRPAGTPAANDADASEGPARSTAARSAWEAQAVG